MRLTDGIFLDACRQISSKYNDIHYEEMLVDACAATLSGILVNLILL